MFQIPFFLKQIVKPFSFLFLITICVNQGKSKDIQPPSTRNYIVVFDIDSTLCKSGISKEELEFAKKYHPECPIIHWTHDGQDYPHIFLPYLQILFDYLLEKGVRIVCFSSAIKERNIIVIPELLTSFWGSKKYEGLKSKGQFSIFSRDDMRKGNFSREGHHVKDLKVVLRDGESLSDVILVEDDTSYAVHDQRPCIKIIDLTYWSLENVSLAFRDEFSKNTIYYMLGLFHTYFEHDKYKKLLLREGLMLLLPPAKERINYHDYFRKHPFTRKLIETGLSEVQKKVPNATLYGSFKEIELTIKKEKKGNIKFIERIRKWFFG